MDRAKYFKFYFGYKQAFTELSGRKAKKLLLALVDYVENDITPKLDKKTMLYFMQIKVVIDGERLLSVNYGKKGSNKRWNKKK